MLCVLLHSSTVVLLMKRLHQCLLLPLPYDVRAWLLLVLVLVLVWLVLLLFLTLLALRRQQGLMLGQMGLVRFSCSFLSDAFNRTCKCVSGCSSNPC